LQHEFGGNYITDKKESVKNLFSKRKLLGEILTGKKSGKKISKTERVDAIFDLFKGGNKKSKVDRFLSRYKDIKGRYKAEIDDPMLRPQSPLVPNSRKKIKSATAGAGKRISKEQLFTALTSIVESLNKTAEALGKTTSDVSAGVIRSANSISDVAEQIKVRSSTIEDKLDTLISAINNQTQVQKQSADKAKDIIREKKVENIRDVSGTEAFDDLTTPEDETQTVQPTTQITNIQNVIPAATSAQKIEQQQMDAYSNQLPQAEQGGVFSGPDSGYNVRLHGNEVVVPLDNNYTQGQPSAVDGVKRPKPRYEKGTPGVTNNYSSVGGKFGFGITNMMGIAKGGTTQSSALAQPLVDAMSLPMMAAGGSILAATSKYINSIGGESGKIKPELDRITRPIADVFGVPPSIVSKTKSGKKTAGTTKDTEKDKDKQSKSDIIAKMSEGFAKFLEKMGESINTNPPPPPGPGSNQLIPGDAPPEIKALMETISGGEGGPNSVQGIGEVKGLSEMTIDQAISKAKSFIGKGSTTGALGAFQFHSDFLRQRAIDAGLDPSKDKFSMENQTQIMRNFMTSVYTAGGGKGGEAGLVEALKGGKLESDVFPKLSKDLGWPSLPGGSQPNVHTAGSAQRYKQSLTKYQTAQNNTEDPLQSSPGENMVDLGQQITQNFGLGVGKEREFQHPQYGNIKAHKTKKGFVFFKPGLNNKLDMSSDKPQAQSIVDYFVQTNGGQSPITPPDAKTDSKGEQASLNNGISKPTSFDTASAIRPTSSGDAADNLTAFVSMPEATPKNASTTGLPNAEDATIGQGIPDSGIRNAFLSTPVA
jgi:hypothetical protein